MAQIQSQLDPHSEAFARNRAAMLAAIEQVQQLDMLASQIATALVGKQRLEKLTMKGAPGTSTRHTSPNTANGCCRYCTPTQAIAASKA